MGRSLSPWISRLLAVTLLVAPLLFVGLYLVLPLIEELRRTEAAIAETQELVERFRRVAAERQVLTTAIAELRSAESESGRYLAGSTAALAAAELQSQVSAAVEAGGGALQSLQTLPARDLEGVTAVGVRVGFTGPLATVVQSIYALEGRSPLLVVSNLEIRARLSRSEPEPEVDPDLTVRFDVSGFMPEGPI